MAAARSRLAALLILALFVVGGGLVVDQYWTVESAVTTQGEVVHADVESYTHQQSAFQRDTDYVANVSYAYTVDGERFTSDQVYLGGSTRTSDASRATELVDRFSDGEQVTVHYVPSNPDDAYLVAHYSFFPGFVAMSLAVLLGADFLTPGTRWLDYVKRRVTRFTTSNPGRHAERRDEEARASVPDDPMTMLDDENGSDERTGRADDGAVATGWLEWAVWGAAGLAVASLVGLYVFLSTPPYSTLVVLVAGAAISAPVVRFVVYRVL
jgi:hypothetical protein